LNLFDEMRTGQQLYRRIFHEDLPRQEILQMVTSNSARALMMEDKIGTIAPGLLADLLVLERQPGKEPLETLLDAQPHDVALVLVHGKPKYGDREFQPLFDAAAQNGRLTSVNVESRPKLLVGDLDRLLQGIWNEIGRRYVPEFLPVDVPSIQVQ
jgi:adenine deaminase